jgi:uncharacterized protein YutD
MLTRNVSLRYTYPIGDFGSSDLSLMNFNHIPRRRSSRPQTVEVLPGFLR